MSEPVVEFRFLGQFALHFDGEPVRLTSRPAQSLLAYLCLHAGKAFRREKLAGMLWPETSETNARNNLRQALWRIRKALEDQDCLLADDLSIAFDARAPYWLDVEVLTQPLPSNPTPADLAQTVAVYGGELLPGFYDEWTVLERERLQAVFERRIGRLLERLIAERDWSQTVGWSERWIALGASPEAAFRSLMLAHAAQGNLSAAGAAYQRCTDALWRDLGVEPSEQTTALYRQLRNPQTRAAALPGAQPTDADVPLDTAPHLLNTAPYPGEPPFKGLRYFDVADSRIFFGRARLVASLVDRLSGGEAFLAVIGASGSGKSSLIRAGIVPTLTAVEAGLVQDPASAGVRWHSAIFTSPPRRARCLRWRRL